MGTPSYNLSDLPRLFQDNSNLPTDYGQKGQRPITLNGMPLMFDREWQPLCDDTASPLDNLLQQMTDGTEEPVSFIPNNGVAFKTERMHALGRRASAAVMDGNYGRATRILRPVMTPPMERALNSGSQSSVAQAIKRATGYVLQP